MSLISDIRRSKMTFSIPCEVGIDACVMFEFNVNRALSRNGEVRAPVLLSCPTSNQGPLARLCASLPSGACAFETFGISPAECLEMARLSEKHCDHFLAKTRYGAAILISRFIPSYGIAILLFPDEETKISVTRVFKRVRHLSPAERVNAMLSNDSDMLKRTDALLGAVEKSAMADLPIGAKSLPRASLISAAHSISTLIGVRLPSALPINQETLDLSPALTSLVLYVIALISARLSPDRTARMRLTDTGRTPTLECKLLIPELPLNESPFFSSDELSFLLSLSKQINLLEGYSVSRVTDEERELSELTLSLILHEPDPSEAGLKAPRGYLEYFKKPPVHDGL